MYTCASLAGGQARLYLGANGDSVPYVVKLSERKFVFRQGLDVSKALLISPELEGVHLRNGRVQPRNRDKGAKWITITRDKGAVSAKDWTASVQNGTSTPRVDEVHRHRPDDIISLSPAGRLHFQNGDRSIVVFEQNLYCKGQCCERVCGGIGKCTDDCKVLKKEVYCKGPTTCGV